MMAPFPLNPFGDSPSFGKFKKHMPCHLPQLILYWGFVSAGWSSGHGFVAIFIMILYTESYS